MTWPLETLICRLLMLCLPALGIPFLLTAQQPSPVKTKARFAEIPQLKNARPASYVAARKSADNNTTARINADVCNNTTFRSRIPVAAGEQINLTSIKTFPNGNYLVAATLTLTGGEKEGLLLLLHNDGTLLQQKRFRVDNRPVVIHSIDISLDGTAYVAGLFNDGFAGSFLVRVTSALTIDWTRVASYSLVPAKITVDLYEDSLLAVAVQLPGLVQYGSFRSVDGSMRWEKLLSAATMTGLVGFSCGTNTYVTLVINRIYNGRPATEMFDVFRNTGAVHTSGISGIGADDRASQALAPFNNRVSIAGIKRDASGAYQAMRLVMFASTTTEVFQTWQMPAALDFNTSIAMDNAGDVLGFFLPSTKKLLLVKRFPDMQAVTELVREYDMPDASSLVGMARSFDGGILMGLNTDLSREIILIKTDSLGILPACGYQTLSVTDDQQIHAPTISTSTFLTDPVPAMSPAVLSQQFTAYNPVFDCRENFCPEVPDDDTCLKTYHKVYRSGSYGDIVYEYHLMRDNRHIFLSSRYDRVLGDGTQQTWGLKLLDERGNFIKGVDLYNYAGSAAVTSFYVDDRHILLFNNEAGSYNLTLVNDDLQKVWSRTIRPANGYYSAGMGLSDVHKDREGNIYLVATGGDVALNKHVLHVYKMDANGNDIWQRSYNVGDNLNITSCTSTATGIIVVIEASPNNISARIDKITGQMTHAYAFNNRFDSYMYRRHLHYDAGRIFYASNNNDDEFTMGLFDTTGRPTKLRTLRGSSIMRAAYTRDNHLYGTFFYWNGTASSEVLLKVDSNLNPVFMVEYQMGSNRYPQGMGVGEAGYIYTAGWFMHGPGIVPYPDSYLIKYDQHGRTGVCSYSNYTPDIVDVAPNAVPVAFSQVTTTYTYPGYDINLLPAVSQFHVSSIYCSSTPDCDTIFLTDNGPICRLDADYPVTYNKNHGCTAVPQWMFDTAFVAITRVTDTTGVFRFIKPGNTWVKASLNNGCRVYEDSIELNIQDMAINLSLGADTTICPADSLTLDAGAGYTQYIWQDGSGDPTLKVKTAGMYYVEVSNSCGDRNADTIIVAIDNIPSLDLGPDISACIGDSVILQAQAGFASYTWYPAPLVAGQGPQIKTAPLTDTSISVEASTAIGCTAADTIRIQLLQARPVYLGADTSFCATDSLTMNAGSGYQQYQWSNGSTASQITVKNAGTYRIEVRDANGCYARDTLVVQQLYPTPMVALGADRDLCEGNTLLLDAGNFFAYEWHDGSTGRYFTAPTTGNYWVTVTNSNNCKASDSISIVDINPLPGGFLKMADTLCQYEKLTIVPAQTYNRYEWSNGSIASTITVDRPGQYILTVTDNEGCVGKDTIQIVNKQCLSGFFVPNAFTPNRDGKNDVFRPRAYGPLTKYTFTIYNRYGERIFSTTDPYAAWDGTYNGKQCDNGTYVWQCSYQFEGRELLFEKGIVMLIH